MSTFRDDDPQPVAWWKNQLAPRTRRNGDVSPPIPPSHPDQPQNTDGWLCVALILLALAITLAGAMFAYVSLGDEDLRERGIEIPRRK
jgi:hypothetical protein